MVFIFLFHFSNSVAGVANLKKKRFTLMHGMADEIVPFQHSMLLTTALLEQNVDFDQLFAPDSGHSMGGRCVK